MDLDPDCVVEDCTQFYVFQVKGIESIKIDWMLKRVRNLFLFLYHVEVVGGVNVMISNMSVVSYHPSNPNLYPCPCFYLDHDHGLFAKLVMPFEEEVGVVIVS
jgi:hypothetical protein